MRTAIGILTVPICTVRPKNCRNWKTTFRLKVMIKSSSRTLKTAIMKCTQTYFT